MPDRTGDSADPGGRRPRGVGRRSGRLIALAALATALWVPAALPAAADQGDCVAFLDAPDHWADDEDVREYFEPPPEAVPPALVPFLDQLDCATKDIAGSVPDEADRSGYVVHFVDVPYSLFVDLMAGFVADAWTETPDARQLDEANVVLAEGLDVDGLAAIGPDPWIVQSHFVSPEADDVQAEWRSTGAGAAGDLSSISVALQLERTFTSATGFASPSVLSTLRTIAEALPDPTQTAVIGGAAVVLMLVVGYPGALLDSVIGPRYAAFDDRIRARRRSPDRPARPAPSWLVWPGIVAAAVIAGFVDPAFGWNGMSARLVLTGVLSFAVLNVGGWMLVRLVVRRIQPDSDPRVEFRWGTLVLLAFSVILTRLLAFEPGVIFGLVAGLAFAITLVASRDALVILLGSGFALVVAMIGWAVYSLVSPIAASAPSNAFLVSVSEFASGVTIEGVSTLPLALLPLAALDGAAVFAYRKWVWALAYAVGVAAFFLVLVTIPDSWGAVSGDFVTWILVFVGFAVVAVAVWGVNALVERNAQRKAVPTVAEPPVPEV